MSRILNISIADGVWQQIHELMRQLNKQNRSEVVEELIRTGLKQLKAADSQRDNPKHAIVSLPKTLSAANTQQKEEEEQPNGDKR